MSATQGGQVRGRGTGRVPTGRFEELERTGHHSDFEYLVESPQGAVKTSLTAEVARSIVTQNKSPDVPFELGINPYRGCEHGCIYCYARPAHNYVGLSAGLDFETKLFYKPNAPQLLEQYLRRKAYQVQPITIGGNTDAYQPVESQTRLTRQLLEVMDNYGQPVSLITKSDRILRDLDLLQSLASRNLVSVAVSLTTLRPELGSVLEPRAATPSRRLNTVRTLRAAGVPVMVLVAPVVPGLTDEELEELLGAAAENGAQHAGYIMLRLPHDVKDLFEDWLQKHYPTRAKRVLKLIEEVRGGQRNDARFGKRMRGTGIHAALLKKRFQVTVRRLGLNQSRIELSTGCFAIPPQVGDQLGLPI